MDYVFFIVQIKIHSVAFLNFLIKVQAASNTNINTNIVLKHSYFVTQILRGL